MKLTTLLSFAIVAFAGLAMASSAYASSQNLLTNGGFDLGSDTPNDPGGAPTGWHADMNYGAVELVNSATGQPDTGAYWVDLDASPSAGAIYQDVPTIPGHSYLITLKHAANPNCEPGVKEMAVKWGGQTIDTVQFDNTNTTPSNMDWLPLSYQVMGSSGTTTRLEFASETYGSCGPGIDSVSVVDQTAADAQPSCAGQGTCDWNLEKDFEFDVTSGAPTNPFPDSYGYRNTWSLRQGGDMGGALATLYNGQVVNGLYQWVGDKSGFPWFGVNPSASSTTYTTATVAAHKVAVHPDQSAPAVVTWASPVNGTVNVTGGIIDDDCGGGDGVGWEIVLNDLLLYDGSIQNCSLQSFSDGNNDAFRKLSSLQVSQGDTIQFIINADPGNSPSGGDMNYDTTELDVDIVQDGNTYGVRPAVQTGSVADVNSGDVTVTGTVNPEGQATTWWFEYAPSPSGPWTATTSSSIDSSNDHSDTNVYNVSAKLAPLSPDSTYYYRVVAVNGAGEPVDGNALLVHTNPITDTTPPNVTVTATGLAGSGSTVLGSTTNLGSVDYDAGALVSYTCTDPNPGSNGARASGLGLCEMTDNGAPVPASAAGAIRGGPLSVTRSQIALPTTTAGAHTLKIIATDDAGNQTVQSWTYTVKPENKCPHLLDFGVAKIAAGPIVIANDDFRIGISCLTRDGLTWTTNGSITFGGLHISADPPDGKIIIDPLNMLIRTQGRATVTIGPWFTPGKTLPLPVLGADGQSLSIQPVTVLPKQVGPFKVYDGPFTWELQGGPLISQVAGWLARKVGGWFPQSIGGHLPQLPAVKLPNLGNLPQLPDLPLPDFSKIKSFRELATMTGVDPGKTYTDLSQPTVKFNPNLVPNVNLPTSCIGTTGASVNNDWLGFLPFLGHACLTISNNTSKIEAAIGIPDFGQLGDVLDNQSPQLDLNMTITPDGHVTGLQLTGVLPPMDFGPLNLDPTTITYNKDADAWHFEAGAGLFRTPLTDDLGTYGYSGGYTASGKLDVVGGKVTGAVLQVGVPDVPLFASGLYLEDGAIGYLTQGGSPQIVGSVLLGAGPVKVPTKQGEKRPIHIQVTPSYDLRHHELDLNGTMSVLDPLSLPNANFVHLADAYLDFNGSQLVIGGSFGLDQKPVNVPGLGNSELTLKAALGGKIVFGRTPQMQLDADATADVSQLKPDNQNPTGVGFTIAGHATASNNGLALCGELTYLKVSVHAGLGYKWGTSHPDFLVGGGLCDLSPYRVMSDQAHAVDARAAATATSFTIAPSQHQVDLRFSGQSGAPRLILTGPGGVTISPPAGGSIGVSSGALVMIDDSHNTTEIDIATPAAGRWTVTTAPGSTPIVSAERSDELPPPDVHAHVVRRHGHYLLVYRMHAIAGQQVTFSEQSASVKYVIGTASKASGSIRFSPAYGPAGPRSIVAAVQENDLPRETDTVGSYQAPAPLRPAKPRQLRIVRRGLGAVVSWRPARGAHGYSVTVVYNGGFQFFKVIRGTSVRIPLVYDNDPILASVAALDLVGKQGTAARARTRGYIPAAPHRRRGRHH